MRADFRQNCPWRPGLRSRRRRSIVGAALVAGAIVVAFSGSAAARAAERSSAADFVASVGQEVVEVLAAPGVGEEQRRRRFGDIFARALDLDVMARRVLGRHWRTASEAQKRSYVRLFRDYVLGIYAVQLGGYRGEEFTVLRDQPSGASESLVVARILRKYGAPLDLNFRVRDGEAGPRIVDVTVAGVSLIVTKRSEFDAIIQREGLPGLLRRLDAKAADISRPEEDAGRLIAEAITAIGSVPMLLFR